MAKQKNDTSTTSKASDMESRRRSTLRQSTKTSTSIVEKLRQQSPAPTPKRLRNGSSKPAESAKLAYAQSTTTLQRNSSSDSNSNSDTNSVTLFQIDLQDTINDNGSVDTETADNLQKDLLCTRVDL